MAVQAKITLALGYRCAPNGVFVETFPVGSVVSGQVAEWALADKAAARLFDPRAEAKVITQVETKSPSKRGRPRKDKR